MRVLNLTGFTLLGAGAGSYLLNDGNGFALKGALIGACVVGITTLLIGLMDIPLYKKDE